MDNKFRAFLDAPDAGPVKKIRRRRYSPFSWAVFLLLLTGFALASWIGSFYVFAHPEDPRCYAVLTALKKIDPVRRFDVTAAPVGRFYTPKELYDSFLTSTRAEIEQKNGDLLRNYLRNYSDAKTLVPYMAGRFKAVGVYELKSSDMFPAGVVAVAESVDCPQVMIEHVYSTQPSNIPKVRRMLAMNPDIILAKTFDLSAVVHAEKMEDGKFLFTVVPLGYGNYAFKQGISSTFRLEPPRNVNLEAGMPLVKPDAMGDAVKMFAQYRKTKGLLAEIKTPAFPDATPKSIVRSSGPAITPPPVLESAAEIPENVENVTSVPTPSPEPETTVVTARPPVAQSTPVPSTESAAVSTQPSPSAPALSNPLIPAPLPQVVVNPVPQNAMVTQTTPGPASMPPAIPQPQPQKSVLKSAVPVAAITPSVGKPIARVSPGPNLSHIIAAMHSPAPKTKVVAIASATPAPAHVTPASTSSVAKVIAALPHTQQPAQTQSTEATAGGVKLEPFMGAETRQSQPVTQATQAVTPGTWRTYAPGQMPRGKLLDWQNIQELASLGMNGGRFYIRGKYIVTASSESRVVLRPQGSAGEALSPVRLVVEFPAGVRLPVEGSPLARGEMRPFQIVDVRRGNDGQVNVYAREITNPWQVTNTADLLRNYHQQRAQLANKYLQ